MTEDLFILNDQLPRKWNANVKSAVLHVISLAQMAVTCAHGWAARHGDTRTRSAAELEQARNNIASLEEEIWIKDARMARVDPSRRPRYRATERLAILELRAANGWSNRQTAKRFLMQPGTIGSWMERVDASGESALVQTGDPVNRFPDYVRYVVRRLKVLCPQLGKKKIAEILARAGLHLGVTTVKRMLEEQPRRPAKAATDADLVNGKRPPVKAKYVNHTWHMDLTVVPMMQGLWTPWLPHALTQAWPFCWWVVCVVDHFSRRAMGFAVFSKEPTSLEVRTFLGRTLSRANAVPKYLISDQGGQFSSNDFKAWCRGKGIGPRYGSVGQIGAIAIVERYIKSLKDEWLRRIAISFRRENANQQIAFYFTWYNEFRPHRSLGGRTPQEVYTDSKPRNEEPRFEPRLRWPKDSPCAAPSAEVKRRPMARLELIVTYHGNQKQLPVVTLKEAA